MRTGAKPPLPCQQSPLVEMQRGDFFSQSAKSLSKLVKRQEIETKAYLVLPYQPLPFASIASR